jgi:glycosyltransferase involved in cell wall biosynthesis
VSDSNASNTPPVAVTVAICTYNRAHLLRHTLDSLTAIEVPAGLTWEVLVVNNNSPDDTAQLCDSYMRRLPLRVVLERAPGISNARNCALRSARGEYLLFIDDDVRVYPDWLDEFWQAAARYPDATAFGGPIEPDFPAPPDPDYVAAFPALAKGFCGLDHCRPEGVLSDDMAIWTANTAYRMARVRGLDFDPRLGSSPTTKRCGEEEAFLRQLRGRGAEIVWLPSMKVKHYVDPVRMTLPYLESFQVGKGEEFVYQNDWAWQAGTTIMGVPPRLALKMARAFVRYQVSRLALPRAEALKNLSRYCYYRGMLKAVRAERASGGLGAIVQRRPPQAQSARAA